MKTLRDKIDLEIRRWAREYNHTFVHQEQTSDLEEMLLWWDGVFKSKEFDIIKGEVK